MPCVTRFPTQGYERTSFFSCHNIACLKLQLWCYNLITVLYPAAWPQQLRECNATVLYNAAFSLLPSISPFLYVYADDVSKHCSLPPPAPPTAVKSNISALSPLQRHKTQFEHIKYSGLFWLARLINSNWKLGEQGLLVQSAVRQLG